MKERKTSLHIDVNKRETKINRIFKYFHANNLIPLCAELLSDLKYAYFKIFDPLLSLAYISLSKCARTLMRLGADAFYRNRN